MDSTEGQHEERESKRARIEHEDQVMKILAEVMPDISYHVMTITDGSASSPGRIQPFGVCHLEAAKPHFGGRAAVAYHVGMGPSQGRAAPRRVQPRSGWWTTTR